MCLLCPPHFVDGCNVGVLLTSLSVNDLILRPDVPRPRTVTSVEIITANQSKDFPIYKINSEQHLYRSTDLHVARMIWSHVWRMNLARPHLVKNWSAYASITRLDSCDFLDSRKFQEMKRGIWLLLLLLESTWSYAIYFSRYDMVPWMTLMLLTTDLWRSQSRLLYTYCIAYHQLTLAMGFS